MKRLNWIARWYAHALGRRELTEEERHLAVRIAIVNAIPMVLIILIPLIVIFFYARELQADRISRNVQQIRETKALVERLEAERKLRLAAERRFDSRLADLTYANCLDGEIRDTVLAEHFQDLIRQARREPDTAFRRMLIEDLQEQILTLEPPSEPDCVRPASP